MGKIFIVHFQPLEKYPPVMNMLRYLAGLKLSNWEIHAVSTDAGNEKKLLAVDGVTIHRVAKWKKNQARMDRLLFYIRFQTRTLALLRALRPEKVLYYETLSAGAPVLYKRWYSPKSELFIHYHEYTSPEEYKSGMLAGRWLHKLEKSIYKKAVWVSHTNEHRAKLFVSDLGKAAPVKVHAISNYPPMQWQQATVKVKNAKDGRIAFVYVGALSLDTMYVEAFAHFIARYPDRYYWDIYSDNFSDEVVSFFEKFKAPNIFFRGGIEYDELPSTLPAYDTGVILYKGHIPNYIYNAPNKLFEYLATGLNVWFPVEMKGCEPYESHGTRPEVRKVDFNNLDSLIVLSAIDNKQYEPGVGHYFFENHITPLTYQLVAS